MKFSVIICTYNREKYIYNVLKSIADQNFAVDDYEILLINNNCTDNTEKECLRFEADYPSVGFRYIVETNQGLSYARNRGVDESKGEILVFVDDDATIFDVYFDSIDRFFNLHPDILACGGPIVPVYEAGEPKWLSHFTNQLIGGALYEGDKAKPFRNAKYPGGGNSAFRRTVFERYGIFNVELGRKGTNLIGAEEKDLYDRLQKDGQTIYYLPQMGIYHYIPPQKLTKEHFDKLTYSIGQSERIRTLNISKNIYYRRLLSESIKWSASIFLFFIYLLSFHPAKGYKLLQFRKNVTKGLLGK